MKKIILMLLVLFLIFFTSSCFLLKYEIKTNSNGNGQIILNPKRDKYSLNEVVTIEASPEIGWLFSHWSGDIESNKNPFEIKMDSDKNITANFEQLPFIGEGIYTLKVEVTGNGTAAGYPLKEEYEENEEVTMTATPDEGYVFHMWVNMNLPDYSNSDGNYPQYYDNPWILVMDGDKDIIAVFGEE